MNFELTQEQHQLQESVRKFAQAEVAPLAQELDRNAVFPTELFQRVGEMGITAVPFDEAYGGMGCGVLDTVLAIEELARADQSLAVGAMVSIATGLTLQRFGTEAQKEAYLPGIVQGKHICAIAGTEPDAGSDTSGFKTRAIPEKDGWKIRGEKAFITNCGTDITSFTLVLAVTSPPDAEKKSFSLFLVPSGSPGLTIGPAYSKMGWRSSDTHPMHFDDCPVGPDQLVGETNSGRWLLHKGYQQARLFLAASSVGLAQACLDESIRYANERKAFGNSIGRLQLVQEMVAQIAVQVDAARLLTYRAASLIDQGAEPLRELSMAKLYACDAGTRCADLAIQVHGGYGYMDECPASRYYRDNRICTIGDGSTQIQTLLIARECGLDVTFR